MSPLITSEMVWQPIETAPEDCTAFLAWDPLGDALVVCYRTGGSIEVAWTGEINPDCTHWMPLPEPPK